MFHFRFAKAFSFVSKHLSRKIALIWIPLSLKRETLDTTTMPPGWNLALRLNLRSLPS